MTRRDEKGDSIWMGDGGERGGFAKYKRLGQSRVRTGEQRRDDSSEMLQEAKEAGIG